MRTTLTLDPDVVRLIEEATHRRRQSFKETVNDAIRRGLSPRAGRPTPEPFRVVPHDASLCPGVDPGALNRLADELEDDVVVSRAAGRRRPR